MDTTIICPNCKKRIEISEALKHQFEEKFKKEIEEKIKKELGEKEGLEVTDLKRQSEKQKEQLEEFREQELKLREEKRTLEEKSKNIDIEFQRRLDQEKKQIEERILKNEDEKIRLKEKEKDKIIEDLKNALEDARRKASLSSQQLQGEVLELDLEQQLKSSFPMDEFSPIPKGIEGADIWQKIKDKKGEDAGSIIWETKRTKSWSNSWLAKLREDKRRINASECILISEALPSQIKYYGRIEEVWIASYESGIILARTLRYSLLKIAAAKAAAVHKDERLQQIYEYIISEAFKNKFDAHFESVRSLKEDLESEKRAMERIWKKREIQIQRLDSSAAQMFGELQGIAGPKLETIKNLELTNKE